MFKCVLNVGVCEMNDFIKESLTNSMKMLGLNDTYINKVFSTLEIDECYFDQTIYSTWFSRWFKNLDLTKITAPGRYFISTFKTLLKSGAFKTLSEPQPSAATTTLKDLSVEDFEKEWDEWCRLVEDLSLDPENPDVPGKGILIGDLHCVDGARGISTGDGGFVYLDGTVSKRFRRFEDLSIQEKEDLINTFEKRNSVPRGRLIIADALLQKTKSLMGGHENERDR